MLIDCEVHCCHISCVIFGQLSVSVSFLGPCCPAPLYCIAVYDCLMLTERINDDDDNPKTHDPCWPIRPVIIHHLSLLITSWKASGL